VGNPYESIEKKEALVKPNDPNSVKALVDEIFNFPRAFPRMPTLVEDAAKDRLVQAEMLYRQGKKPGVQEQDVVRIINDLADKLGGPPHSKTTHSQLCVLRMSLSLAEPRFMGTGVARQGAAFGEPITPSMGPAQAVHLIGTLIDQKFLDPDFQVTPQEWEDVNHQKHLDKMQERQAHTRAGSASAITVRSSYSTDKRRELEESLRRGISSLSLPDRLHLVDQALTKLGI
jgi:hypothetical protein